MLIEFCLPIYNEEKILEKNTLKLLSFCQKQNFNFDWKIMIIINGSTDNSLTISQKLKNNWPDKINYINIKKPGRGQALKKYWIKSQANILAYMDIDLAVSLKNIPDLINPILEKKSDVVMGSRLLSDSKINRSFIRELSSQGYNFLSRLILNHHFADLQCGFKAIRANTFKKIAPFIIGDKWFFDTELIIFARKQKAKIKEIPVNWSENRYDTRKSKVNILRDSFAFFCDLIKLKVRINKIKN